MYYYFKYLFIQSIEGLTKELAEATTALSSVTEERSSLFNTIAALNQQVEALHKLELNAEEQSSTKLAMEEELERRMEELGRKTEEKSALETQIMQIEKSSQVAELKIRELEEKAAVQSSEKLTIKEELQKKTKELEGKTEELATKDEENFALETQIMEIKKCCEVAQSKIRELEENAAIQSSDKLVMKGELERKTEELERKIKEIATKDEEKSTLEIQYEEHRAVCEFNQMKIRELEESSKEELEGKMEKLAMKDQEISILATKIIEIEMKYDIADLKIRELEENAAVQSSNKLAMKGDLESLKVELERKVEEQIRNNEEKSELQIFIKQLQEDSVKNTRELQENAEQQSSDKLAMEIELKMNIEVLTRNKEVLTRALEEKREQETRLQQKVEQLQTEKEALLHQYNKVRRVFWQ